MSAEQIDSSSDLRRSRPLRLRTPSAAELLDAWERGLHETATERALTMLAVACPDARPADLAELSIGRRDAGLLGVRERIFGPQLMSLSACPKCSERLELAFAVSEVRSPDVSFEVESAMTIRMDVAGYEIIFRTPNSLDLLAVGESQDVATGRQLILDRCLLDLQHPTGDMDGETIVSPLPAEVMDAIAERMSQADPQADVQLALCCPRCAHQWHATFDIVSFLWNEIDAWANRFLREVHILASTYKWSEADIFNLSPWRRQVYLEMIGR